MATKKSTRTMPKLLTEADGRALAIKMLREANDIGLNDLAIREHEREGRPQNNIVLRYLDQLREAGNRRVEIGFSSVLTDFVGSCADERLPDLYEQAFQ